MRWFSDLFSGTPDLPTEIRGGGIFLRLFWLFKKTQMNAQQRTIDRHGDDVHVPIGLSGIGIKNRYPIRIAQNVLMPSLRLLRSGIAVKVMKESIKYYSDIDSLDYHFIPPPRSTHDPAKILGRHRLVFNLRDSFWSFVVSIVEEETTQKVI